MTEVIIPTTQKTKKTSKKSTKTNYDEHKGGGI